VDLSRVECDVHLNNAKTLNWRVICGTNSIVSWAQLELAELVEEVDTDEIIVRS
jgi:hypothetical protein